MAICAYPVGESNNNISEGGGTLLTQDMLKEYMEYRCSIYYWLKNLYLSEPTIEILEDISQVCKTYSELDELPKSERKFIEFFANLNDFKNLYQDIKIEYTRLFLGPKRPIASPYESVYTSYRKQIFGESAIAVKKQYEEMGLKIQSKAHIPEDFIGYELEFMYYLAYFTVILCDDNNFEKINDIIKYQQRFLEEHLKNWIEQFTSDIVENTNMEYFKVLGKFTKEFIIEDYNSISKLI